MKTSVMKFISSFDSEKIAYKHIKPFKKHQQTIVFIHGLGGDPNFLIPIINKITKYKPNYNIISYNLRGHGHSSKKFPKTINSIENCHTKDLTYLLNQLNIEKPILIGHSLGGIIAQEYLSQKITPLPKKIILICSPTDTIGTPIFKNFFYKLLQRLPSPTKYNVENPLEFHLQFSNGHDISLKRFISDTQIMGGFFHWMLNTGSILGWKNKKIESINQENLHYIYSTRDMLLFFPLQKWKLRNLSRMNKNIINSNHICPITDTDKLANIINKII